MAKALVRLSDLTGVAKTFLVSLVPHPARATLVTLQGDLGAGKTTFVQAVAKELGITQAVQSPTYVLMKKYPVEDPRFTTLVHIDAYRLVSKEEFAALDPEAFLSDPKALVCIEWPERVAGALPAPDRELRFSSEDAEEGERYIEGV